MGTGEERGKRSIVEKQARMDVESLDGWTVELWVWVVGYGGRVGGHLGIGIRGRKRA